MSAVETYVAFVRAINVGGHASVRMTDLKDAFTAAGCKGVRTYIQSGNVIFESADARSPAVFRNVRKKLHGLAGDGSAVVFRSVRELERSVAKHPFADLTADPAVKLYVTFLSEKPRCTPAFPFASSKEALEAVAIRNLDVFVVSRRKKTNFYGFPNNFIEKELGVPATSRNWSTLTKIIALIRNE